MDCSPWPPNTLCFEQLCLLVLCLPAFAKVLRASKDYQQHRQTMYTVLQRLVHMDKAVAKHEVHQQLQRPDAGPLDKFLHQLYKLLLESDRLIPCREDSTLEVGDTSLARKAASDHSGSSSDSGSSSSKAGLSQDSSSTGANSGSSSGGSSSSPRYFFATNLRDNSILMPQFVLSLTQTLLHLPVDTAFVSVYESNSDDGAHGWIDILQLVLNVMGVPSRLITRGMLVRTDGQHRIEFLAQARNMVLAPLYSYHAAVRQTTGSSSGGNSSSSNFLPPGMLPWGPDYVVFINDVFFCWGMVLRLLNYRADITCGMDWWQNPDATVALPSHLKHKDHQPKPNIPQELQLETPIENARASDQTNPIVFYDVWVARDIGGSKFWWTHPFIVDQGSSPAALKGLPVRASCCWNGLVVLSAAPFAQGMRFRTQQEGECRASECSLLCEDYARLGYDYVVVDAGVQMAYDWELAREMMALGVEGVGQSTWAQVKAAGVALADKKPEYGDMECCNLRQGAAWVNFNRDCSRTDIMVKNYTQEAMQSGFKDL
eukprot:GHRR01022706.1.p1 GENE.GHRR01022706.1~~GHRR01022706.1.p1  ORF type:complete len:543 (+),score=179.88 GHRR01022706.1:277-1905(+)